jgi:hypothetical protein
MSYAELHKEMWLWLADHPDKNKWDWPRWGAVGVIPNHCFACAEADTQCMSKCPVVWGKGLCMDDDSLYTKWRETHDPEIARKIANGWRERV